MNCPKVNTTTKVGLILASTLFVGACRAPEGTYANQRAMPTRGASDAGQQQPMDRQDGVSNEAPGPVEIQTPTPPPVVVAPPPEPVDLGPPPMSPRDSSTRFIEDFCNTVLARNDGARHIGCLPLVSYSIEAGGPSVSDYGVEIANQVSDRMMEIGYRGMALDTNSMGIRISKANTVKASLSNIESVATHGARLGTDLIVFGSIRRDNDVGRAARDVLTVDLNCWDFRNQAMIAREKFEVPSDDRSNTKIWRLAQRASLWAPDDKWGVGEDSNINLMAEIRTQTASLTREILKSVNAADIEGVVYIPPTDTSPFVQTIAALRAAQASFGAEYNRRVDVATAAGTPLDTASPVSMNGLSFPNLQAAQAKLETMREDLLASSAVRFGQSVSSMMGEAFQPSFRPHEVRVNDLGFTKWSDTQLVEGELALGGLARSAKARAAMKGAGITLVIAPRLERFGNDYALRADVYDLNTSSIVTSAHVTIANTFTSQLESELAVQLD